MTPFRRSIRAVRHAAGLLLGLAAFVLVMFGLFGSARAADPATLTPPSSAPNDVPTVTAGVQVTIPPVPASFQHRDLGWLKVDYTPNATERVNPLLAEANEFRDKLSASLGQRVLEHVEVRIVRTPEEMTAYAPVEIPPPAYAVGVAYPGLDLILLTLTAPHTSEGTDLGEVFRHELAHIALHGAVGERHVPTWFNEGLAIHLSGEKYLDRQKALWDARLSGTILPLNELDRGFPSEPYQVNIAYAESADFVRYLLRQADRARFEALIQRVRDGQAFDGALANAYGTDLRKLEYQWRSEVDKKFNYLPVIMGGSLLWAAAFGVMIAAYVKRRRASQVTLARWEREEAALDAAIERARAAEAAIELEMPDAALVRASSQIARSTGDSHARDSVAKVEHEGHWHTLH